MVLANPAAGVTYAGLKHTDDADEAYLPAELLRLKILPQGPPLGGPARVR